MNTSLDSTSSEIEHLGGQEQFDGGYQDSSEDEDIAEDDEQHSQVVKCGICPGTSRFANMDELEAHIETEHATMNFQEVASALENRPLNL